MVIKAWLGWGVLALALPAQAVDLDVQVLDREGRPLPGAVLVLESSAPGSRPPPKAEVTIAQQKMKFVPAISVVQVGAQVSFTNLDRWDHHVRGGLVGPGGVYVDPAQGYAFRLAGQKPGQAAAVHRRSYTQTGPQLLGCHLHGSMRGHLYVTDSPWAEVSDAEGRARLSQLPVGPARLRVWHADELVETPAQTLQIAEGMAAFQVTTKVQPKRPKAVEKSPYDY